MHRLLRFTVVCVTFAAFSAIAVPSMAGEDHMAGGHHMASKGVTATGTVNSVDAAEKKVNITHEPIPALAWPGMTMDFQLGDGASLAGIEPGTQVVFQLRKLAGGSYEIESLNALGE